MKIKEIASFNPKGKKPNDYINYVDTSSVEDGKLVGLQTLSKDIPSRAQRVIEKNDILISSVRPILKHNFFVGQSIQHGVASTGFIQIRVNNSNVLPRFLYYYLTVETKTQQYQTIAETSQSTFPSFNKDVIEEMEFPNISLETQQHIVDILGTLDEKIENNEKIISNVLKLYRLKFRNLAMKYEQKTVLSYIASVESGKRPLHKSAALDGSFNIPIIGASSIMGYTNDYLFNEPILVIGRVGTLGVVQSIFGKSYPSDNALIIRSKYYTFCYCALNELDYNSLNKGSTQPLITQTDIKNIQIPLIPQSEMQQFEMHNKIDIIVALKEENNMLRELKALYLKKFFE